MKKDIEDQLAQFAERKARADAAAAVAAQKKAAEGAEAVVTFGRLLKDVIRPALAEVAAGLNGRSVQCDVVVSQQPRKPYEGVGLQLTQVKTNFEDRPASIDFWYDDIHRAVAVFQRTVTSQGGSRTVPFSEVTPDRVHAEVAAWLKQLY